MGQMQLRETRPQTGTRDGFGEALLRDAINTHIEVVVALSHQLDLLIEIGTELVGALRRGNQIMWCGNGGSAADCQHLAAEFVGRFQSERRALASIALTTDSSILTAVANDYGFEHVFSRQVEALGRPGDILVGISTSGKSQNVCAALKAARNIGMRTVSFTGVGGGHLNALSDYCLQVESSITTRVQESHILAGHLLCDYVERTLASGREQQA
jgi:D-sedoheptulose 7-phosphate isomerase